MQGNHETTADVAGQWNRGLLVAGKPDGASSAVVHTIGHFCFSRESSSNISLNARSVEMKPSESVLQRWSRKEDDRFTDRRHSPPR
jgi:hypothetical protein